MNSWKVCYPKRLDSLMTLHTAAIMCMDYPSLGQWFPFIDSLFYNNIDILYIYIYLCLTI